MKVLFIQLPVPQQNIGNKSGNVPLAAHYLKAALADLPHIEAEIVPEAIATWLGDLALINYLVTQKPDVLAMSLFCWNIERSLYILNQVKAQINLIAVGGGPEVHPENVLLQESSFDYLIPGEGEQPLYDLLQTTFLKPQPKPVWLSPLPADAILDRMDIRAMYAGVDTFPSQMLLVESQRGCPYKCGFCYYNKSREGMYRFSDEDIIEVIKTVPNTEEYAIYLLDPSLNTRPDLALFLKKLADSQKHHLNRTYGETRVEGITQELAKAYHDAGFSELEIGLQTTNKQTMKLINRPTLLTAFAAGFKTLRKEYVFPKVDLIIGLPGDDLASIKRSIDFAARHRMYRDVQVFPLLLLHGTEFREKCKEYGLVFQKEPPYQIISTPLLSREDIFAAFNYAEKTLYLHFDPMPELDLCETDILVHHADCIGKYHFLRQYTDLELSWLAAQLASTCQLHFYPEHYDEDQIMHVLSVISALNPYGVYEIILWNKIVNGANLLQAMQVKRPHFLDNDSQYLYPTPGNRSVIITAVLKEKKRVFYGEMQRQIFYWDKALLPKQQDFESIKHLDGIYIDDFEVQEDIGHWFFGFYQELPFHFPLCFRSPQCQHFIWMMLAREFNKEILTQGEDR